MDFISRVLVIQLCIREERKVQGIIFSQILLLSQKIIMQQKACLTPSPLIFNVPPHQLVHICKCIYVYPCAFARYLKDYLAKQTLSKKKITILRLFSTSGWHFGDYGPVVASAYQSATKLRWGIDTTQSRQGQMVVILLNNLHGQHGVSSSFLQSWIL